MKKALPLNKKSPKNCPQLRLVRFGDRQAWNKNLLFNFFPLVQVLFLAPFSGTALSPNIASCPFPAFLFFLLCLREYQSIPCPEKVSYIVNLEFYFSGILVFPWYSPAGWSFFFFPGSAEVRKESGKNPDHKMKTLLQERGKKLSGKFQGGKKHNPQGKLLWK